MSDTEFQKARPKRKPRLHFWRCFWLSFLVISLAYAWYCFYVPANEIAWAKNVSVAQQQAEISNKPVIMYFTGTWCVPCRIMKREVWADRQVTAVVNTGFVPVAIDVGDPGNADLLARYQVKGAPVLIVTDAKGNAIDWRAGGIGKQEFIELLESSTALPADGS